LPHPGGIFGRHRYRKHHSRRYVSPRHLPRPCLVKRTKLATGSDEGVGAITPRGSQKRLGANSIRSPAATSRNCRSAGRHLRLPEGLTQDHREVILSAPRPGPNDRACSAQTIENCDYSGYDRLAAEHARLTFRGRRFRRRPDHARKRYPPIKHGEGVRHRFGKAPFDFLLSPLLLKMNQSLRPKEQRWLSSGKLVVIVLDIPMSQSHASAVHHIVSQDVVYRGSQCSVTRYVEQHCLHLWDRPDVVVSFDYVVAAQ
jgi:hypothetical protein